MVDLNTAAVTPVRGVPETRAARPAARHVRQGGDRGRRDLPGPCWCRSRPSAATAPASRSPSSWTATAACSARADDGTGHRRPMAGRQRPEGGKATRLVVEGQRRRVPVSRSRSRTATARSPHRQDRTRPAPPRARTEASDGDPSTAQAHLSTGRSSPGSWPSSRCLACTVAVLTLPIAQSPPLRPATSVSVVQDASLKAHGKRRRGRMGRRSPAEQAPSSSSPS